MSQEFFRIPASRSRKVTATHLRLIRFLLDGARIKKSNSSGVAFSRDGTPLEGAIHPATIFTLWRYGIAVPLSGVREAISRDCYFVLNEMQRDEIERFAQKPLGGSFEAFPVGVPKDFAAGKSESHWHIVNPHNGIALCARRVNSLDASLRGIPREACCRACLKQCPPPMAA